MKINVQPHVITIEKEEDINSGEYNISNCEFTFSEEYENLTKEAIFSTCDSTYKVAILNNECTIPYEVLETRGQVLLGVYGYEITGEAGHEELELRYSPTPRYFNVKVGSYREGNDPDLPKPSEWERVLALINKAITETNNLNITINKEDGITHVVLTKKDGTTQEVDIEDGKSLEFNWRGTELGVRVEGESQYEYVNLKGEKGDAGAIKMQIVDTLPQTGQDDTIYLVPYPIIEVEELPTTGLPETIYIVSSTNKRYEYKGNQWVEIASDNKYKEYVWINNDWEEIGAIGIEVDLTDYYTKQETNNLLNGKQDTIDSSHKLSASLVSGLSTVATSGSYNDLSDKPSIPSKTSDLQNDSDFTTKAYVDSLVGDINTALDTINGEVI